MSDTDARLTALVHGRVQGVGFRIFAIERARALELTGFARNLPDRRSVEVVAEGPRAALESLLDALRRGPTAARVETVEVYWGSAVGDLDDFDARF